MTKLTYCFIPFTCILCTSAQAQEYKGIWHGYITVYGSDIASGYVLNIKEQKGDIITGKAYIYSKTFFSFWGLVDFIGSIDKTTSKITELVIIDYETPSKSVELCIKFLNLALKINNNQQTLIGKWAGETTGSLLCYPGDVFLKRYFASDTIRDSIPAPIMSMIKEDNSPKMNFRGTELTPPIILNVATSTVQLQVHDYLKEDNDSVSIYLNRNPIISKLLIKNKPYKRTIRLDKLSGLNEIIIYADNLGLIPPNTCILTVDDGLTKQRVNIFSTKESSAVVYLNYTPEHKKVDRRKENEEKLEEELRKLRIPQKVLPIPSGTHRN